MDSNSIPLWTPTGVLPPVNPDDPTGPDRSPYKVSVIDLVLRFGTSPDRRTVLAGFLAFRQALHAVGLSTGFQWLDGSFLEDIELIEGRSPRDLDVVTFVEPPAEFAVDDRVKALLDHDRVKSQYMVDHYFVELTLPGQALVAQTAYWTGVWSHQRSMQWKGFLQVALEPTDDAAATRILEQAEREEVAE
ncbi:MAG: DUF6932 family protein [Planctomycetaceae bacterium]